MTPSHRRSTNKLKVALVMDWLTDIGGAERVLKSISELYPDAPIYTSQYRPKKIDWFKDREVKTGWLNIFPAKLRRFLGPLRQTYFSHLDLSAYDLVLSVTGAEAKGVKTVGKNGKKATHFCYCHVPTQYYWGFYDQYIENPGFGILNPLARLGLKVFVRPLRKADYKAAQRPDFFISISTYAAEEIKKYYNRDVKVIHPPVSTELFRNPVENSTTKKGIVNPPKTEQKISGSVTQASLSDALRRATTEEKRMFYVGATLAPSETVSRKNSKCQHEQSDLDILDFGGVSDGVKVAHYYINFSRQVSWKRLDLAIKACIKAKQHLVLIGSGPEHSSLVKLANGSKYIHFLPQMPQSDLKRYLKNAKAFIFPSCEPFGIAPLEALSAGCPVIAYGKGGALDYIEDGKNGLLFPRQSVNSLVKTLETFEHLLAHPKNSHPPFPVKVLQSSAARFSDPNFKKKLKDYINETI